MWALKSAAPSPSPGAKRPEPQVTPGAEQGDGLGGHADFHGAAGGRPGSPVATPE